MAAVSTSQPAVEASMHLQAHGSIGFGVIIDINAEVNGEGPLHYKDYPLLGLSSVAYHNHDSSFPLDQSVRGQKHPYSHTR